MFSRDLAKTLKRYTKFPVVALLGPRQSGKTTLAQHTFPNHKFLTLDNEVIPFAEIKLNTSSSFSNISF